MDKVKIQYIRPYSPYRAGDISLVDADKAQVLVEAGIVKAFDLPPNNKMVSAPVKTKRVRKAKK